MNEETSNSQRKVPNRSNWKLSPTFAFRREDTP